MSTTTSFIDVERHRKTLEQNLVKLEEALDEWRQWKSEYESLKKEVSRCTDSPSLTSTREAYHGDLVNEKELLDIFGKGDSKTAQQVISVLTNRIDYVSKNITSLENQLEAAQNKFAAADVFSNPNAADEGGLPITEIMEELDDDDNVVSYSLQTPGDNQAQLLDALKKAGLAEAPAPSAPSAPSAPLAPPPINRQTSSEKTLDNEAEARANAIKNKSIRNVPMRPKVPAQSEPKPKRKGVTFAENIEVEGEPKDEEVQRTPNADQIEDIMRQAKEQEEIISDPIIPVDESEEEAQLRRDMLTYNLSELNPVVAELTLEEGDYSGDDFDSEDYSDEEEDDEDEDRWGRSTSSILDDDYRQKMIEIQERLLGGQIVPRDSSTKLYAEDNDGDLQGIGRITVKKDGPLASEPLEQGAVSTDKKKGVHFAAALDVADETKPVVEPLSAEIVERKRSTTADPAQSSAPAKRASRFKSSRAAGIPILPETPPTHSPYAPSGPEGKTMADAVLERDSSSAPKEPDELDAGLLRQEAATEYYKVRNRLIQKQGGFMKEDENPIQPLDEEEGGPKRLSRFRAARLAKP
ncbi:zinc finger transcription factor 1 [Apiospora arundinis]|uniref:Prefoldin subunit-domain-containing protein n=1 Tax=Apiospora arundinis TaxID=335852 RepID=A0ABR2I2A1_9PEZI